jgi:transcriptional regulator with XRE-family HTH domain
MNLSALILEALRARGMTQAELASAIGMSPTQLARMLRNADHNYTVRTLTRIAAALDCRLSITLEENA